MPMPRDRQLALPFPAARPAPRPAPDGEADLEAHCRRIAGYLSMRLPEPVDVVFTENRFTMVSIRRSGGRLRARLHRMFRHADDDLLESLARFFTRRDKKASRMIDAFVAAHGNEIRRPARERRKKAAVLNGRHRDLGEVLARVVAAHFGGALEVGITWGRAPIKGRGRRRRSRALANYSFDDGMIRVNPVLDAPDVPDYVLDWIVYHELLHHVLPVEEADGRKRYHTRRFRTLEKAFARYDEARAWERANLTRLLR
ncbi:MAG: hypothetical protein PHU25_15580 [Deltaproteobacteria bacterium]|nr:hypothetical protein [Deltaproteobacteria bacterium]